MGTNNNSDTNANPIDQRSNITNEDDTSSIFNTPTVALPDYASDSGSMLNDEPANKTNVDEDACGMYNGYNRVDDENVGAQETIDEDNIDNNANLSLTDWTCAPMRSTRHAGRDPPSNFNLATMPSSRDDTFFMTKYTHQIYIDAISLSSF